MVTKTIDNMISMEIYTTTNIATATNPLHAVSHHHGWEVSACIGSVAVTIFVDYMTSVHKENYHYKYCYCKTVTKTMDNMISMEIYMTTNIATTTNPLHAVPCHHRREVSACIGSVAVTVFVDYMTSVHKENYHYKYCYCKMVTKTMDNMISMEIYMTTNIVTATNPLHAVPHHHGWEVSACIGSVAVTIFVDYMTSVHKENYHYKYCYCKMVTKTMDNMISMEIYMTTNIVTATNPLHAVPHHHGWEVSACIGSVAVAIFVDKNMTSMTAPQNTYEWDFLYSLTQD